MAIVINSQFDPFSMQDLWSPLSQVSEAHMKTEAELSNFATEGAAWKNYVNPIRDVQANKLLSSYEAEIDNVSNLLMKEGLTPSIRKKLLNLKQSYANNILPISRAVETISQQAKEQRSKGPGYIFDIDMSNVSLDKALENPNLSYKTAHLKDIEQTVSGHVAPFATQILTNPKLLSSDTGQYLYSFIQRGYTPEQIVMAIEEGENVPNELKRLIKVRDDVLDSYVKDWNNPEAVSKAILTANSALYDAVGKMSSQILLNREAALNNQKGDSDLPVLPYSLVTYTYDSWKTDPEISADVAALEEIERSLKVLPEIDNRLMGRDMSWHRSGINSDAGKVMYKSLNPDYVSLASNNKEPGRSSPGASGAWGPSQRTAENQSYQEKLSEKENETLKTLKKKYNVSTLDDLKLAIERKKETVKGYPVPVLNLNNEAMASTKKELINRATVFSSNNDSPIFDINSWGTTNKKITNPIQFIRNMESFYIDVWTGNIVGISYDEDSKEFKKGILSSALFPIAEDDIQVYQELLKNLPPTDQNRTIIAEQIMRMISSTGATLGTNDQASRKARLNLEYPKISAINQDN